MNEKPSSPELPGFFQLMWEKISRDPLGSLKIMANAALHPEEAKYQRLDIGHFKRIKDGKLYDSDSSRVVLPVRIRWVYAWLGYRADDGSTGTELSKLGVVKALKLQKYMIPRSLSPVFDNPGGEYFVHGLICERSDGELFLVAILGSDRIIYTFRSEAEKHYWCESHISADEYIRIFGAK